MTLRAIRLSTPIKLDGQLDEAVYATTPPFTDFFQKEPVEGDAATEKTEVWIFFDDDAIYVTFRCWESRPDALVANEMRRDSDNIVQNDHIAFLFDTFYDRRNGVDFEINAARRAIGRAGHQRAAVQRATGIPSGIVEVGRFDGGWTVEAVIPFKSLRYRAGARQIWGFNVAPASTAGRTRSRILTRVPRGARAGRGALAVVAGRHARRPRGAAGVAQPRDQAVRDRGRRRPTHRSAASSRTISAATSAST